MKNYATVLILTAALTACATPGHQARVTAQALEHHRYVLKKVDGSVLDVTTRLPEIAFGEGLTVSGSMCNRFRGQGTLHGSQLQVADLATTRMFCREPRLNELDLLINQMLTQGARVRLQEDGWLILSNDRHQLIWRLADLVN